MQRQTFKTEDLKSALERSLGFGIRSLVRLGGGGAMNYKAERASDGLPFVVKCIPPERRPIYDFLVSALKTLEGVKTPVRLFAEVGPVSFAEHQLLFLAWSEGEVICPDQLTDGEWRAFLDDFHAFSVRLQGVKTEDRPLPVHEIWEAAHVRCGGLLGRRLRGVLERMGEDERDYRAECLGTVHGDFHRGNLLFAGGRLSCIMDLESCRRGYPAEDICALLIIAARHLKRTERARRERLVSLFRQAVRHLPYTAHEWRTSINALYLRSMFRRTGGLRRLGLLKMLDLCGRAKTSELMRSQVESPSVCKD